MGSKTGVLGASFNSMKVVPTKQCIRHQDKTKNIFLSKINHLQM